MLDGVHGVSGGGSGVAFDLTTLTDEKAAITVALYRRVGRWRVRAIGQGWADGLAGVAREYGIDVDG